MQFPSQANQFYLVHLSGKIMAAHRPGHAPTEHEWWRADLAAELGVTIATIDRWRRQGRLTGRQEPYGPHRWILHADHTKLAELRAHLNQARGRTTRVHPRFVDT